MDGSFLDNLRALQEPLRIAHPESRLKPSLVYGGDQAQVRHGIQVLPWDAIEQLSPPR